MWNISDFKNFLHKKRIFKVFKIFKVLRTCWTRKNNFDKKPWSPEKKVSPRLSFRKSSLSWGSKRSLVWIQVSEKKLQNQIISHSIPCSVRYFHFDVLSCLLTWYFVSSSFNLVTFERSCSNDEYISDN